MMDLIFEAIWFIAPCYVANSVAVVFGGGAPIDGGRYFRDGKRILGDGKTVRGFVFGALGGIFTAELQYYFKTFPNPYQAAIFGFLLGFGGLFGDVVKSFFKRRLNIERGKPFIPFDQLDFVIGALVFYHVLGPFLLSPFKKVKVNVILVLLILTPALHLISNMAGYKLKVKDVWW